MQFGRCRLIRRGWIGVRDSEAPCRDLHHVRHVLLDEGMARWVRAAWSKGKGREIWKYELTRWYLFCHFSETNKFESDPIDRGISDSHVTFNVLGRSAIYCKIVVFES